MRVLTILSVVITSTVGASAQTYFGYISDSKSGERLPNALIYNKKSMSSSLSNSYGYYSLSKTTKGDTLEVRFMGYQTKRVVAGAEERQDIYMTENSTQLSEVEVTAQSTFRRELTTTQMSHHRVTASDIKSLPVMFGEADALKTIQFLPGVNSAADGSTNLSVRGGSYDQNLIMLDEATVYNPSHTMGIFTAFNADAISGVDFYKGDIPARYGGKLSAVVDMQMKEGNNQKYCVQGGIGTIASRLMIEGPIKKDTASFMVSGRFGYSDLILKLFEGLYNSDKARFAGNYWCDHSQDKMHFYDICAKANWTINEKNKVYASGYFSHDNFRCPILSQENEQEWGNQTATLRWNHIFSDKIFANTSLTYSKYNYRQRQTQDIRDFEWKAGMSEVVAKTDFDYYRDKMHITFGGAIEGHFYNPGEIVPLSDSSAIQPMHLEKKRMMMFVAYAGNEHKLNDKLTLSYGLRFSASTQMGPTTVRHYTEMPYYADSTIYRSGEIAKAYFGLEPRLAVSYTLDDRMTVKASYARTKQYQHLLNNSALGIPTDVWTPADSYIKPQTADAFAIGLHSYFPTSKIEASTEVYYKQMHDIIDFKDNADFQLNPHIETEVLSGRGRAWGAEFMMRRDAKNYSLLLSYTLSSAKRQIDGVNGNRWYYAVYDQRHNLALNAMVRANDRWSFSGAFRYHTGGRTTIPIGTFYYQFVNFLIYSERNGYKMPDFHRLDLSIVYDFKHKPDKRFHSQLAFSIYNVYGRKNAYSLFIKCKDRSMYETQGYMLYLYRCVPSLTYTFTF